MAEQVIYTVGGTVQAGGGVYIPRKADDELLGYCRASEFAFILSSRQVGKSSLMVRTARQLESENIRSVIIDLSGIGVKISADQWYLGILKVIAKTLKLKTDIFAWWAEGTGLGPAQQMINFFSEVLLKEVSQPVVLFFDEIDSTLSIPFADDFFAALRAVYNARSTTPEFKRLSFVMIGVATPSDLIADEKRTPFNIGHRVDLTDFTPEEATPLTGNLGKDVLGWIFHWTGGHPYLTQSLCAHLSKAPEEITETSVAEAVTQLFSGERGRQDNNLQFVRDMLTKRSPDIQRVLKTYKDIRSGKKVTDDERSIPKAHLKISGVVRRKNGSLQPRNQIYERAFDLAWVRENTPPTTTRKLVLALSAVTVLALMVAGYFAWQEWNRSDAERAGRFESGFTKASTPDEKLDNLAGIFQLADGTYFDRGLSMFEGMSMSEKISIFEDASDETDQLVVAQNVYQHIYTNDIGEAQEEKDALMRAIGRSVRNISPTLSAEIEYWIEGRMAFFDFNYDKAINQFNFALGPDHRNLAILLDLVRAYARKSDEASFKHALEILTQVSEMERETTRNVQIYQLLNANDAFGGYWLTHKEEYTKLTQLEEQSRSVAQQAAAEQAPLFDRRFSESRTPDEKLNNLARMFQLADNAYVDRGLSIFNNMSMSEKKSIFGNVNDKNAQLLVAQNVYQYVYTNEAGENQEEKNALMSAIGQSVKFVDPALSTEIEYWIEGRTAFFDLEYDEAVNKLDQALDITSNNPAILLDLVRVLVEKNDEASYKKALNLLMQVSDMNRETAHNVQIYQLLNTNNFFGEYWLLQKGEENYNKLAELEERGHIAIEQANDDQAALLESRFTEAKTPEEKLNNLNSLFTLADGAFADRAYSLFSRQSVDEKIGLFNSSLNDESRLFLAKQVYQRVYTGAPSLISEEQALQNDQNKLMDAIKVAIKEKDQELSEEISYWSEGRVELKNENYQGAVNKFNHALGSNRANPVILLDLARAQIGLTGGYLNKKSQETLQQAILMDKQRIVLGQIYRLLAKSDRTGKSCSGALIFHTFRDDNLEIYRLDGIEGQPDAKLYNLSQDESVDSRPSRSQNDTWVVFQSNRDGNVELYVTTNLLGEYGPPLRLTNTQSNNTNPMYGPDTKTVVYQSDRNGNFDLFTINQNTHKELQITSDPADDVNAFYSPDLKFLVFQSNRNGNWDIFILDTETGNEYQLTDTPINETFPAWSPNGKQISYIAEDNGATDLYIVDTTGANLKRITNDGKTVNAVWSPEGNRIAYQSERNGNLDIYSYDLKDGKEYRVTDYAGQDSGPTWDCGGTNLAFTSIRNGDPNIFQVFWKGGPAGNMTIDPATDKWSQWSPSNDFASTGY